MSEERVAALEEAAAASLAALQEHIKETSAGAETYDALIESSLEELRRIAGKR